MKQLNIYEAKTNFSYLIKCLENKEDDIIYIARNGVNVAQMTLIPKNDPAKRIGAAKNKLTLPKTFDTDFDLLDGEISALFETGGSL